MTVNPVLRSLTQDDFPKSKASWNCTVNSQSAWAKQCENLCKYKDSSAKKIPRDILDHEEKEGSLEPMWFTQHMFTHSACSHTAHVHRRLHYILMHQTTELQNLWSKMGRPGHRNRCSYVRPETWHPSCASQRTRLKMNKDWRPQHHPTESTGISAIQHSAYSFRMPTEH